MLNSHENYTTGYHLWMVILSVLVGIFTSYVALRLLSRHINHTQKERFWLISSALVISGGVWAVHFIGMLAVHIDVTVTYNILLVLTSLVGIVFFSTWAFLMLDRKKERTLVVSSILMGIGIFGMHFISMRSMQMEANLVYSSLLLLLSLLAAVLGSGLAFWIFTKYRNETWDLVAGAVALGLGIVGMHYVGMSATTFERKEFHHPESLGGYVLSGNTIATTISIFLFLLLVLLLFQASMDQRLRLRLKVSEEHYKRLVELAPVGITIHKYGIIHYINPAGIKILGAKNKEEIIGKHFLNFIHPDYHELIKNRWKSLRQGRKSVEPIEEKMLRIDQTSISVEVSASPYEIDGESYVQVFFSDITARKEAENMMQQLAYSDALTGLYNRSFFSKELTKTIEQMEKTNKQLSVLFLDLDGFKAINDTYGHDAGDLLIQNISNRLREGVPQKGIISRIGGDEFTIFIPNTTVEETKRVAQSLLDSIKEAVLLEDISVFVTSSIGIAMFPKDGTTTDLLSKHADMAMFVAKRQGKNQYLFYSDIDK
ncbi:diguanylate cyclase domain-containing protein [Ferdinandcohnia sp. Marseille-Q9671]